MRAPKRMLAASTLTFEALAVFFASLVAKELSSLSTGQSLALFGGLAVACLLCAGLLRRPFGYALGTLLQAAVVATGFVVPSMFGIGLVFAALWALSLALGGRMERENALLAAARERDDRGGVV